MVLGMRVKRSMGTESETRGTRAELKYTHYLNTIISDMQCYSEAAHSPYSLVFSDCPHQPQQHDCLAWLAASAESPGLAIMQNSGVTTTLLRTSDKFDININVG